MPFKSHRWKIMLRLALVVLLLAVPVLSVTNAYLWTYHEEQQAALRFVRQRLASDERLIDSQHKYIAAQQTAAKLASLASSEREVAQCRASRNATEKANYVIASVRVTLLDLAAVSRFEITKKTLLSRAAKIHLFPRPTCSTTVTKVPSRHQGR